MTRDATAMAALLLPGWVRILGTVVLVAVALVLARRAALGSGSARLWAGGYAGVAAAMALMFATNPMTGPGPSATAWVALVAAAVALVALGAWAAVHRHAGGLGLPWLIGAVDLVVLGYIQVPSPSRPIVVCVLFAAYLAVQTVARGVAAVRAPRHDRAGALVGAAGGPAPVDEHRSGGGGHAGADTSAALAVLALAMLYMISI